MSRWGPILVAVLAAACGVVAQAGEDRVAALKATIGFEHLPGKDGEIRRPVGLATTVERALGGLAVRDNREADPIFPHGLRNRFLFGAPDSPSMRLATLFVGTTPAAAREMLIESMTENSMPIEGVTAVVVRREPPGDFHILPKGREGTPVPYRVDFARGNVAVSVRANRADADVLPVAKALDDAIRKLDVLSREEYEELLPGAEVTAVKPRQPSVGESVRIEYRLSRPLGDDLAVLIEPEDHGYFRLKDRGSGFFVLAAQKAGTVRVGIVVYDTRSLLSRWAIIPLAAKP